MSFVAFLVIVVGALVVGAGVQYLFKSTHRYEWLAVALGGAFGAYFASETFVTEKGTSATTVFEGIKSWGPAFDGLYIVPAIIGGLILAIVADIGVRTMPATTTHA